ncbi:Uncharacterised protein [Mycobacterium tuberculosis]|uniref:Uncharacterized protein n=1 Tax=Mycobacterium tuberculosis TaxID=1773 RepID=A0A916LDW8_MYCTX|nr:Uncharacterised protein [Mycobacterium tuberculosis]
MNAISRSSAPPSSGTSTGSLKPATLRSSGLMSFRASSRTYSANESAAFSSLPTATA